MIRAAVSTGDRVVTPSASTATRLESDGVVVRRVDLWTASSASADVLLLVDGELSAAGHHAESLIDRAASILSGGGLLVLSTPGEGAPGAVRTFTTAQLTAAVNHRGFVVTHGPVHEACALLAVARAPADEAERSQVFFATLPRKVIAAGTVCTSAEGRMLVVYDRFRQHWTVPGGVVDPDEAPADAARRETWEEGGVHATVRELLGVFHYPDPDRLLILYAAVVDGEPTPDPVHRHEIAEAKWLERDEALRILSPRKAAEVRQGLGLTG